MIADTISKEKLSPIVTELLMRGRKSNVYIVAITQSCFQAPTNALLNCKKFFIMKVPNKRELEQIAFNHLSDIGFEDFMNLYTNVLQNQIHS